MLHLHAFAFLFALISVSRCAIQVSQTPAQTINGIGASGAWWPHDIFQFPGDVRDSVARLLFSPDELGLTSHRYNVGGGGVFVGNPVRAPETTFISPGVYNFSADPQGVFFLKQASSFRVPILTAFVNSAPPAFTSNQRSCGGTLVDGQITAYAGYVADVIAYWKQQGITFTHVSPMNEPDSSFGSGNTTPCGQEGMIVTPQQRATVVNALRTALNNAGLGSVGIMADESSSTGNFIPEASTWIPNAKSSLAAIAHHQYGFGNDNAVAQLGQTARNASGGVETWFTEICCWVAADSSRSGDPAAPLTYRQGFDPTIVGGLQLAQLLYQSFTQTLDAHFDFWTAASNGIGCDSLGDSACATSANTQGWNDGLIYYDGSFASNGNFAIYTAKRFFVLKHFSQFVPLGATRLTSITGLPANVLGLAFKFKENLDAGPGSGARSSLILMNMGGGAATVQVGSDSFAGLGAPVGAFQTTQNTDWIGVSAMPNQGNVALPGHSTSTFLFA